MVSAVDGLGQTVTTLYDRLGRPTSVWQGAAGSGTRLGFYTYDTATLGKSRPTSSTSYDAGNAYTESVDGYDADGRALGVTVTIPAVEGLLAGTYDTTTSDYDAAGHPLTIGYPAVGTGTGVLSAETVTTGYNSVGEAATLTGTLGSSTYVSATRFLNWGPLTARAYGTGTVTAQRAYGWDQATGWLSNVTTTVGAITAQNDTYGYDTVGEVREIASTAGTAQQQCYAYDGLNRLSAAFTATAATVPSSVVADCGSAVADHAGGVAPYDLAYAYDVKGLGNLATVTDDLTPTATVSTYAYPADTAVNPVRPHAVASVTRSGSGTGADSYGYNADGAQTSRTVAGVASTLVWSGRQQLASVTDPSGTTGFVYDVAGGRLIRRSPTETVLYLPGQELHFTGTVITPTRYYTCGDATVAQRVGGGALTWLTGDSQGSAQVAVNATTGGYVQQRYLPFGAQRGAQGPLVGGNRAFLGHTTDPSTGLLQDGARYYDTALARFVSPDPINTPYDPQNLNAYSYAANNPTTASDPSGLMRSGPSIPCPTDEGCGTAGTGNTHSTPNPMPGSGAGVLVSDGSGGSLLVSGSLIVETQYNIFHPVDYLAELSRMYGLYASSTPDIKLRFLRAAIAVCYEGMTGAGGGCGTTYLQILQEGAIHQAAFLAGKPLHPVADQLIQDALAFGTGAMALGWPMKGSLTGNMLAPAC